MPKIFISYRRSGGAAIAQLLHDKFESLYGEANVFMDTVDVPVGTDFREWIDQSLLEKPTFLVIIDSTWEATLADRIKEMVTDEKRDWVRYEVEEAIKAGLKIIPILLDGVSIPDVSKLPEGMKKLAYANGIKMRLGVDYKQDLARLLAAIPPDPVVSEPKPEPKLFPAPVTFLIILLLILIVIGLAYPFVSQSLASNPTASNTPEPTYTDTEKASDTPSITPTDTPGITNTATQTRTASRTPSPTGITGTIPTMVTPSNTPRPYVPPVRVTTVVPVVTTVAPAATAEPCIFGCGGGPDDEEVCGNDICEAGERANGTCNDDCGGAGEICGNDICEEGERLNRTCNDDCGG